MKILLYDLHVHSTASDGQLTPRELVILAIEQGVSVLSLTDHDRIDGIEEAGLSASELGLDFIPGVELSVDFPQGEMHLLGYGIDLSPTLLNYLAAQVRSREVRNLAILGKLRELGFDLTLDEVLAEAMANYVPGERPSLGRNHFAMALVRKGYVASTAEAFSLYLANGKPAYADRERALPEEAIAVIHQAGGIAVLAHPFTLNLDDEHLYEELKHLKDVGLDGLEVFHSDHSEAQQITYRRQAELLGLLLSGGSDFHGSMITPDVQIGRGKDNNLDLSESSIVEHIRDRISVLKTQI